MAIDLWKIYKQYRNKITSTFLSAKNMHFTNQFLGNQIQWNTTNTLLGRSRNGIANIELHPTCIDTTTTFNEHF